MTDKDYTDEPFLTHKAIQQSIFNAVKLKTNVEYVGKNEDDENNNKTGGPFSNAIWLVSNYIPDDNKQYAVGKIYDNSSRNIVGTGTLNDNKEYIKIKTSNAIISDNLDNTKTINANSEIGINNNINLYKIPMLDGRYVMDKFLYNDVLIQNLLYKINYLNLQTSGLNGETEPQKMFLNAYDIVELNGNNKYISNIYTTESATPSAYEYTLNTTDNTFKIDGNTKSEIDNNPSYIYYPTTLYVKTIDTDAYYRIDENEKIYNKLDTNYKIDYMYKTLTPFTTNYTYEKYTLQLTV